MLQLPDAPSAARWLTSKVSGTSSLTSDSRRVRAGDGFLAWPGRVSDGRAHVPAALAAGAAACLVEAEGAAIDDARVASLAGLKRAAGDVADAFFGAPSRGLSVVASTGTNGKTSTVWWTAQALSLLGRRCGVVGTLGIGEPPRTGAGGEPPRAGAGGETGAVQATGLTSPDAVALHAALRGFVDQGFTACALEASSIGIVEHRLGGLKIDVALFTNLTQDHLDYHGDMAAYWAAKRQLFAWPGLKAAVLNIDDAHGAQLAAGLSGIDRWTVSLTQPARLRARGLRYEAAGLVFDAVEGDAAAPVRTQLVGDFNASNLLVVLAGLRALGVPLSDAAAVAPQLTAPPGRLQRLGSRDIDVVVDYAHTPDALDKVLQALRPMASARAGKLWCVFGCGGDRDARKRPLMGAIASRGADVVVITSDNPRSEPPAAILAQIAAGADAHAVQVEDRREAIRHAVRHAAPGDVILLAGKGHEDYQEVAGIKRPFSDLAEAQAALASREGREGREGAAA